MNLMKLFNVNYLKQNLKKSKVVLSIFIGLIPVLNTIILIMALTNNKNHLFSLSEISIINLIGIYVLPVIVSICLFNYIYKKKSVDFINSMPISRKSIFVTNTILGILIFLAMLFVNVILILILSSIFNTQIPFMMLVDYFWFFLVVYIFCYSATNLAMTISGNAITQIVLTLLLFFLVPFTTVFTTWLSDESTNSNILIECTNDICTPDRYYCYDDLECNINKDLNRYETNLSLIRSNHYTVPFGLLYGSGNGNSKIIDTVSVVKMLVLSVVYVILGYILFVRRKMEISETSFKSLHIHNIVKSLTMVPIVAVSYLIFKDLELIFIIFIIVLMLVYYFVYDLITRKNIQNIRLSLLYFVGTIIILTMVFAIVDKDEETNMVLKYNDIKEVAVDINQYYIRNDNNKIYVTNKELIKLVTKEMLNEEDYDYRLTHLKVYIKTKDNKEYKTYLNVKDTVYDEMLDLLSNEKDYINYYKNINFDNVYAVEVGNKLYSNDEADAYLQLINKSLKNLSLKEFLELERKYSNVGDGFYITLYTYENHDKQSFSVNGYINYDLLNSIVNSNNSLLKENITSDISNDYSLYYANSYLDEEYDFDYYVLKCAKNEIYNFILNNLDSEVDMRKEYISLEVYLDSCYYQFTTNKVDEIINILENKYNEIKDTPDYKNYYGKDESVEYYD